MRVISKRHDYYDSVNFAGETFVRQEQEPIKHEMPNDIKRVFDMLPDRRNEGGKFEIYSSLIGFCGHIYPLVEIEYYYKSNVEREKIISYSISDLDRAFAQRSKSLRELAATYRTSKKRAWYYTSPFRRYLLQELFMESGHKINDQIFFDLKSPIFIVNKNRGDEDNVKWIANPILETYAFQRVFGPYEAHQEIAMYLGGVLGNTEIDTVGISDEDLAKQKGFDKYSFKRMPGKGRPKDPR